MKENLTLNLLVVDEDQLLAEKVLAILQKKNIVCSMQIVDEKSELDKILRRKWDIALFGKTYDIKIHDLLKSIRTLERDLPVIALQEFANDVLSTEDHSDKNAVEMIEIGVSEVFLRSNVYRIALAVHNQLENVQSVRKLRSVQSTLAETEMRATLLLENSRNAVAYISEGMHIFVNQAYQKLFGYEKIENLIGIPVIDLIAGKNVTEFKDFLTAFMKGDRSNLEFLFESIRTDGSTFEAKLQLAAASHEGDPCTQIIIHQHNQDSDEVKAKLVAAERTDGLTGLGNRKAFDEDLKKVRSHAINQHATHALIYINIDKMDDIRDSFGIEGTDSTLVHISNRLSDSFSEALISRFSDSGFAIIQYNTEQDVLEKTADSFRIDISKDLIDVNKKTATTTVSIGIAMITDTSPDSTELFQRAFSAIEKVKEKTDNKGNGIHVYDPYANATGSKTAMFETVNNALDQNMFRLVFQPIYQISDDSSNFYEVYLRLPLADGTEISPDKFLDIAEQCNMLERLDRWVLLNATKALRKELANDPNARLLINLSKASIYDKSLPEFAAKLNQAIGGAGNQKKLTLQFNEQEITHFLSSAIEQFSLFRQAGCGISINNFGLSESKSLDLFTHTKPGLVKLERRFASNLESSEKLDDTLNFITQIKEHGVDAIMAFIEDAASMSASWRVGAPYLQGLYLQPPASTIGGNSDEVAEDS